MNWIERQAAKLVWGRVRNKMPWIKKWVPMMGSAFGLADIAKLISTLGGFIAPSQPGDLSAADVTAAVAGVVGIILRFQAQYQKARSVVPDQKAQG